MTDALKEFHDNKQAILDAGARQGSHGELDHFNIPKLEMMKHVVPNIKKMGIANQYTSDITERYLIEVAKKPFCMSNHHDAPPQMVKALDRTSRLQISTCYFSWILNMPSILEQDTTTVEEEKGIGQLFQTLPRKGHPIHNYFEHNISAQSQTEICNENAYHLYLKPHYAAMPVDEVACIYNLPDLHGALADYFVLKERGAAQKSSSTASLPFEKVNVWYDVKLQSHTLHNPEQNYPVQTLKAIPPSPGLPDGWCNTALVVDNDLAESSGLEGHALVQVCLIMQPAQPLSDLVTTDPVVYVHYFTPVTTVRHGSIQISVAEPALKMYCFKKHLQSNKTVKGDIIPLSNIWQAVQLIPKFDGLADRTLNSENCLAKSKQFYLNTFSEDQVFQTVY